MSTNTLRVGLNALENIGRTTPSPYAAGILIEVRSIVETALVSKENDQIFLTLAERVTEICTACVNALPKEGLPTDIQATYYIGRLLRVLDRIAKKLLARNRRGKFTRLVLKSSDAVSLKELGEQLEHCAAMLSLHLQMDNVRLSGNVNNALQLQESEVAQAIAKAKKEEMDLIKTHFTTQSKQDISKRLLPAAPHIFHGRSREMQHIVPILLQDEASYVCVLGTGGVGKTSFGLAALHHPEVIACFHSYRYFVPCDALTDASGLLTALASLFKVAEKKFWVEFPELCRLLGKKIILMLDNFESPWEPTASRKDVEVFLSTLANIPNVSIIITLRGAERPYGIPWTRPFIRPLTTLDIPSAKQTFIEISDVSENAVGLEGLLVAVDMSPLAVTLLANQAQWMSCLQLLDLWKTRKTSMVTRGMQDRFSSLDISIQISLSSSRMLQCPDAPTLLQILYVLPDGTDDTGLREMAPTNFNFSATTTAIRVGLAYHNEAGRLRSLSPVREHVQVFQSMDLMLFRRVSTFHNSLTLYAHDSYRKVNDFSPVIRTILPQIGNIHSVLALSLTTSGFEEDAIYAVACIHLVHYVMHIASNRQLLDSALRTARSLGNFVLEADCLMAARMFDPSERYMDYLEDASAVYRKFGTKSKLAESLLAIAHRHLFKDSKKVIATTKEVINELQPEIPSWITAYAYELVILQYCQDGNIKLASSLIKKAFQISDLEDRARSRLLQCMADLHGNCGRLSASLECATQSIEIAGFSSRVEPYGNMAQVYFMQR